MAKEYLCQYCNKPFKKNTGKNLFCSYQCVTLSKMILSENILNISVDIDDNFKKKSTKEQIWLLYSSGKNRTEIKNILGCSKSTVFYHLGAQKGRCYIRSSQYKKSHPLMVKRDNFLSKRLITKKNKTFNRNVTLYRIIYIKIATFNRNVKMKTNTKQSFTMEELINKIGQNPLCYLTGKPIDLMKSEEYSLDHIIPVSRGGSNNLDNLGLCTRAANMAKSDLLLEELYELCQQILNNKNAAI